MKRRHVTAALGLAVPAAVLSGLVVYLLDGPAWAAWVALFVSYCVFALCFLIVVEALTEEAPHLAEVEESPVGGLTFVPSRRLNPLPHYRAEPGELFASLINANDATVVMTRDYQGRRRMGVRP